jgi:hypothetical protein
MNMELEWHKSSYSGAQNNCVEVAALPGGSLAVRDSKHEDSPVLTFSRAEWAEFIQGVRSGKSG